MKMIKFLYTIIGVLFICVGCHKNKIVELGDCKLDKIVKSVSDVKGFISFNVQAQQYTVKRGIDGTYDSVDIGIPCNLPESYNIQGLKVQFSGNYYECSEYSARIPGETYYYLEITEIKHFEEE